MTVTGEFAIHVAAWCDRSDVLGEFDATWCDAVDAYFDSLFPKTGVAIDPGGLLLQKVT